MASKSGQSGVFVVDLSGLNLPKSDLEGMEKAINATVQKQLGALKLRPGTDVIGNPPRWYGIIYWPSPQITSAKK